MCCVLLTVQHSLHCSSVVKPALEQSTSQTTTPNARALFCGNSIQMYAHVQVHCCVTMMNWQGIELIAQH